MLSLEHFDFHGARNARRGWHAHLALLIVVGLAACDSAAVTPPVDPGSLTVSTETSGFNKDDSYALLVGGQNKGTIGANDEVTVSDLDPADYQVELGDIASNCAVDPVSVPVEAGATANALLSVTCAPADPVSYTIDFNRERPNLDNGEITTCPFGFCDTNQDWDLYVYEGSGDPSSIIRQNQTEAVEIAHVADVTLDTFTEQDLESATFTAEFVSEPFDAGRVILIKTDLGAVYALGNPSENTTENNLTFDAVLLVEAP